MAAGNPSNKAAPMKTVSLKLSPKEKKEELAEYKPKAPEYPWGSCIRLDKDEMKKLGIDLSDAAEGATFTMAGKCKIVGYSMSKREGGEDYASVELQITDLGLEAEGGDDLASSMYPGQAKG